MSAEFDVVVWGASGFTGRLVAEYLLGEYGVGGTLRWAIGGRNEAKLEQVRTDLGEHSEAIPILLADSSDKASLQAMVARTAVIASTVGPYARYGTELVAACAEQGTHYCDLTGEVPWMRQMMDAYSATANESGARIVHTCGFDSIPSDVGCYLVHKTMRERHGLACAAVKYRARDFAGGFSGGTVESMMNMLDEAARNPALNDMVADPYSLNPPGERSGPDAADSLRPVFDEDFDAWVAPFIMAAINTRVVRRSNALLDYEYGRDFRYDEGTLMKAGVRGYVGAAAMSAGLATFATLASFRPTRRLLQKMLPAPGEGPDKAAREAGFFDIVVLGKHPSERTKDVRLVIRGDRDPGYGSTAKMLGEAAVALAQDPSNCGGGFWTPATALGESLLTRLPASAGVTFELDS